MTEQAAENEVIGKQSTLLVESLFVFVFFGCFKSFCFRSNNVVLPDYLLRFLCLQHLFFLLFFINRCAYIFSGFLKFIIKWRKTFEFRQHKKE